MSRKYENAKIYKLVSNKTEDVYIGSCLITLARRLGTHKGDYNECSSKRMFEVPDAIITIVQIEALPNCKSKAEMKARELYWMTVIPCININRPFVTDIEIIGGDNAEWQKAYNSAYYIANTPAILEKTKAYYTANAPAIIEKAKKYQADHATEIAEYETARRATPESKEYQKQYQKAYRQIHKDKLNKRDRERYAKNKEEANREIQTQSPLLFTYSKEQKPSV